MIINVTVNIYDHRQGGEVLRLLNRILRKETQMAATLDDVLNDVTAESTVIDSIGTLVKGLQQQLADALSGTTLPAPVQAKVDAIFAQAEANKAKLADAVTTGTPADTTAGGAGGDTTAGGAGTDTTGGQP